MPEIERLFFADSDLAIQVISQKSNLNESEMHTLCAWILAQTVLDLVSKDEIKNAIVSPRIDKDARRSYRMIRDDILSLINIILLDILLVFWRDMRPDRAVLAESSVQPGKGTAPVSTAEGLHSGSGEPDICLLPDVFKGNGAVYALHKSYAKRIVVAG